MVGTKLSEMMAFIQAAPESILCTSCTAKAAEDAALQRQLERERIYRRMEMRPDHPQAENIQQMAYGQPATLRKRDANKKESGFLRLLPRRAVSTTERNSSVPTYVLFVDGLILGMELRNEDMFRWGIGCRV
jgi:hypothetical protein